VKNIVYLKYNTYITNTKINSNNYLVILSI